MPLQQFEFWHFFLTFRDIYSYVYYEYMCECSIFRIKKYLPTSAYAQWQNAIRPLRSWQQANKISSAYSADADCVNHAQYVCNRS